MLLHAHLVPSQSHGHLGMCLEWSVTSELLGAPSPVGPTKKHRRGCQQAPLPGPCPTGPPTPVSALPYILSVCVCFSLGTILSALCLEG